MKNLFLRALRWLSFSPYATLLLGIIVSAVCVLGAAELIDSAHSEARPMKAVAGFAMLLVGIAILAADIVRFKSEMSAKGRVRGGA